MGWNVSANECQTLGVGEEWAESWKWIPQSQMFLLFRRHSCESCLEPDAQRAGCLQIKLSYLAARISLIKNKEHKVMSYVNVMHKQFALQGVVWIVCHQSAAVWLLHLPVSNPGLHPCGKELNRFILRWSNDRWHNFVSDSINISIFSLLFFVSNSPCSNQ